MSFVAHPNVQAAMQEEPEVLPLSLVGTDEEIRKRIIHVLTIYPKISISMLQIGIGTSMAPNLWKHIYQKMVDAGQIVEEHENRSGPTGRFQTYKIVHLPVTEA